MRLGTCLFTMVDPHPGHERAYHRWYERDHFYAGMLAGPHCFAGRRWIAPRQLRSLPRSMGRGSFLATYWIEAGAHDRFLAWASEALGQLQAGGRMFEHRDHVHTGFYELAATASRDPDGVPAELALDHPFAGLVAVLGGESPRADGDVALRLTFTPLATPGFELSPDPLHVLFLDADPVGAWSGIGVPGRAADWAAAFVPTVPGTDAHLEGL